MNSGPIASGSVVRVQRTVSPFTYRYFMAFVGGNGDIVEGRLYWATSDDAVNWTVYTTGGAEYWSPLLRARYTRSSGSPRSTPACAQPSAITHVQLAYEAPYMYAFVQYQHPIQPECTGGNQTAACINSPYAGEDRAQSQLLLRFSYNEAHPFGFGSGWQIFHNNNWQAHSGSLTWRYDVDANGVPLSPGTDSVIQVYQTAELAGMGTGAGDIKWGNNKWLRLYVTDAAPGQTVAQTVATLDPKSTTKNGIWSAPQNVDLTNIRNVYTNLTGNIPPGIHYGRLRLANGTFTGDRWWLWLPAPTDNVACYSDDPMPERVIYAGLSLIPAQLCTPDVPCGP